MLESGELRDIFQRTEVVRRPTYGIIRGYHELPYVCLGDSQEAGSRTTEVRGRIQVSPRFVLRPADYEPSYAEIFGPEFVDAELAGRIFGFWGFRGRPVDCNSEELKVTHHNRTVDEALGRVLDDLARHEDITTGVILTPNSQYFPVSIERFITTVLEDEFSV